MEAECLYRLLLTIVYRVSSYGVWYHGIHDRFARIELLR